MRNKNKIAAVVLMFVLVSPSFGQAADPRTVTERLQFFQMDLVGLKIDPVTGRVTSVPRTPAEFDAGVDQVSDPLLTSTVAFLY